LYSYSSQSKAQLLFLICLGGSMKLRSLFLSLAALSMVGCTWFGHSPAEAPKPNVQFTTNLGSFIVELDPGAAPQTVENFLEYVKSGFYKGTTFHRIISTFMVQGGGHTVDGKGKDPTRGPVVNESKQAVEMGLKNVRGAIAMARTSDPNSATSQFFVNVVDNLRLDYPNMNGYCVFGHVVEGMDTIDKIKEVKTGQGDRPVDPVVITDAKILTKAAAKKLLAR
jgi:peptidyl-prolyl cis-trans isomerase A (cyclophilin A)